LNKALGYLKTSASFLIEIFSCSLTSIIFFLISSEYGCIDDFPLNSFTFPSVPHSCEKRYYLEYNQVEKLEIILKKSESLRIAYEMKEEFREIYETNMTVKIAQTEFKDWLDYAKIFFQESASTIVNHFEGICNYFLNRTTSGVMEGINNRIKLIMRQGYGFSNFDNFPERVLACFSN
jgi:transposase